MRWWKELCLAPALSVASLHAPVIAQELPEPSFFPRYDRGGSWPTFTTPVAREDWFDFKAEVDADKGLLARLAPCRRQRLADKGINVFGWHMMAFQGNPTGGVQTDFEATGLNDFGLDFNLEKLAGIDGLSIRTSGSWAWGQDLTPDVGAGIAVNTVFSGQAWRYFELYAEQWMLDDTVSLRIGRQTIGWEYGLDYDMFTQYLSGAFRLNTFGLGVNSPNFSLIPFANWGARLKWQPDDYWKFQASFMNGHPRNFADDGFRGLQLDFQPGKGSFFIAEGTYRWNHSDEDRAASGGLPGQLVFGGYYDTGQFDFLDGSGRMETGLGNLYIIGRQKIWEPEPISHLGVHVWSSFGYGWDEPIATFPYYWNGGLVWQGPFGTRSDDTLALGFARGWYSDSLPGQSTETVLEAAYNWYVNDVWTVTPDVQYIVSPGGTGTVDDSLLLGLLIYLTF